MVTSPGPLPETVVDFWRIVWQERVPSIVMITNLEEGGKPKCQQYWPDSGTERFGPFQVSITEQQILANYTIRKLTVQVCGASALRFGRRKKLYAIFLQLSNSSAHTLEVTQFHFMAWPDHGVPESATPILAFHRRVKKEHNVLEGPMVVHCR